MKVSDILRILGDLNDAIETSAEQPEAEVIDEPCSIEVATIEPVDATQFVQDEDETEKDTMVAPLQQKHELLKKATGVENEVDKFADDDEIEQLKQLAAVSPQIDPAILNVATDKSEVE